MIPNAFINAERENSGREEVPYKAYLAPNVTFSVLLSFFLV
jgi:hypothetical protein